MPINYICQRDDKDYKYFTNIYYSKSNNGRVVKRGKKFFVHKDYDAPFAEQICKNYYILSNVYCGDYRLATMLAKRYKKNKHFYLSIFRRLRIKKFTTSVEIAKLLNEQLEVSKHEILFAEEFADEILENAL